MKCIKVYIVDDHNILVEGLINMLRDEPAIELMGFGFNTEDCMTFVRNNDVEIILMDINLGEESGVELCKIIKKIKNHIQIIAISSFTQGSYIENMLAAGASGYLFKNSKKDEIISAIYAAKKGQTYLPHDVNVIYENYKKQKLQRPVLTRRELEIMDLIRQGYKNTDISKMLFISIDTVDTHRKNLYTKLGVNNTASLINIAAKLDLI